MIFDRVTSMQCNLRRKTICLIYIVCRLRIAMQPWSLIQVASFPPELLEYLSKNKDLLQEFWCIYIFQFYQTGSTTSCHQRKRCKHCLARTVCFKEKENTRRSDGFEKRKRQISPSVKTTGWKTPFSLPPPLPNSLYSFREFEIIALVKVSSYFKPSV